MSAEPVVVKCPGCGCNIFAGEEANCLICMIGDTPFVFWTCPNKCNSYVDWNADHTDATCRLCGCKKSDNVPVKDDAVCRCGKPSMLNEVTQQYVGCCEECMPF